MRGTRGRLERVLRVSTHSLPGSKHPKAQACRGGRNKTRAGNEDAGPLLSHRNQPTHSLCVVTSAEWMDRTDRHGSNRPTSRERSFRDDDSWAALTNQAKLRGKHAHGPRATIPLLCNRGSQGTLPASREKAPGNPVKKPASEFIRWSSRLDVSTQYNSQR